MSDGFPNLEGADHLLLTTFRRNGTGVPTPLWFVERAGRLYCRTMKPSGKLLRMARDPSARVGPCTADGTPTGPDLACRVRELAPGDPAIEGAEADLAVRYGDERVRLTEMMREQRKPLVYLEICSD